MHEFFVPEGINGVTLKLNFPRSVVYDDINGLRREDRRKLIVITACGINSSQADAENIVSQEHKPAIE